MTRANSVEKSGVRENVETIGRVILTSRIHTLFEVLMCTPPITMKATPRKRNNEIIHLGVKTTNEADRRCCLKAVSAKMK